MVNWLVFVTLVQLELPGEGESSPEELPPSDWSVGNQFSWLMIDRGRPSPRWAVPSLGRWSLGCIKKQAERATDSKVVSSISLCSLLQFLPEVSVLAFLDVTYNLKVK